MGSVSACSALVCLVGVVAVVSMGQQEAQAAAAAAGSPACFIPPRQPPPPLLRPRWFGRAAGGQEPDGTGSSSSRHRHARSDGRREVASLQKVLEKVEAPEGVAGPVVEELGRARLRRPELARAVLSLGMQLEAEATKAARERERAERAWAEKRLAETEKQLVTERMKRKETELLRAQGLLSLRSAIEAFQHEVVRPALGLGPKEPITPARWNQFLAQQPELRARIERQTSWRKEKVGFELSHIYTSLSGRVHGYQLGTQAVTISQELLTYEECLGAAALLDDFVLWQLDPPVLQEKYDDNEAQAKRG